MKKIEKIKEMTVFEMADFLNDLFDCHEICEDTCVGCEVKCNSDTMRGKFVEWLISEDTEEPQCEEEVVSEDEEEVEVNSRGTNRAIKFNILDDDSMKKAGFRFIESLNLWYLCKPIKYEITFNVSIPLDREAWIDVLDDDFGQPYDYQYMLEHSPEHEFANYVREKVECFMEELMKAGIIEGHNYGEYI